MLKRKFKKTAAISNIPFLIFALIMLAIYSRVRLWRGDDLIFRSTFRRYSNLFNWANAYYRIWSGRLLIHSVLILFLSVNLIWWKTASAIVATIMVIAISRLCINRNLCGSEQVKCFINMSICCIYFFIPAYVLSSGALWVTGAATYLWPDAFGMLALLPYKFQYTDEKFPRWMYAVSVPACIFAANSEQMAAILSCFGIMTVLFMYIWKRHPRPLLLLETAIAITVTLLTCLAPGNLVRKEAEIIRWYPNFDMLSFPDKLFQGFSLTFQHLYHSAVVLMLIICILVFLLSLSINERKIDRIIAAVPMVYSLLGVITFNVLPKSIQAPFSAVFFNYKKLSSQNYDLIDNYLPILFALAVTFLLIYLLFASFEHTHTGLLISVLYLAALASSIVMGFSPTVYASGNRVFFLTDILLVVVAGSLLFEFQRKRKIGRTLVFGSTILILIALLIALNYFLYISSQPYYRINTRLR